MSSLHLITDYLDRELEISSYEDFGLNGLQFEGAEQIDSIAVSVDAGESVIQKAAELGAKLLIVHHGILWNKPFPITGSKKRIYKLLHENDINLYAVHLPLDGNMTHGNGVTLAKVMGLKKIEPAFLHGGRTIGCIAQGNGLSCKELAAKLETLPGGSPMTILPFGPEKPKTIGIVSGGGISCMESWQELGFDTFITGEPKQYAYHYAKENGLNIICAGHYRTETVGVDNLGKLLSNKFNLPYTFIDEPTGI